ncbi:19567_t:CDS:2 [Funneliformis geosporum]|uniref:19567_t:CDS:1 n=1 Tax=Funneliformis geosporum TaxID=1117311 RepID=A0A9W4WMT7_9GLOM|nr:19567_t:CDS:2 [Funneliformis geosporum]
MINLSELPIENVFKVLIYRSLMKGGFISSYIYNKERLYRHKSSLDKEFRNMLLASGAVRLAEMLQSDRVVAGLCIGAVIVVVEKLNDFVIIHESDDENNLHHKKLIFDVKQPLIEPLATNYENNEKLLKSFFMGFGLARQFTKKKARIFVFLFNKDDEKRYRKGIYLFHQHLIKIYGKERVIREQGSCILNFNR